MSFSTSSASTLSFSAISDRLWDFKDKGSLFDELSDDLPLEKLLFADLLLDELFFDELLFDELFFDELLMEDFLDELPDDFVDQDLEEVDTLSDFDFPGLDITISLKLRRVLF